MMRAARQLALSGATPVELRRWLRMAELDRHNRRVTSANMPKHGLDYEAMMSHRQHMAASLLDTIGAMVRPYAPPASTQDGAQAT